VRIEMRIETKMEIWVEVRIKAEWVPSIYSVEINK
jgi:hypothetical protein